MLQIEFQSQDHSVIECSRKRITFKTIQQNISILKVLTLTPKGTMKSKPLC